MKMRRRASVLMTAGLLTVGMAASASAADSVTQSVTGGQLTASVADLTLPAATYDHADQTKAGTMTLSADDRTGTGDGWNVTIQASPFVYSGDNGGTDISATNFSLTAAGTPTVNAGQAVDATGGPKVPSTSPLSSLDTARKVIQADVGFGLADYRQALDVKLTIPGQSRAGTYTGVLTTTITAAP